MAPIGRPEHDGFKIAKVAVSFSNLFHSAEPAHDQHKDGFRYKTNLNSRFRLTEGVFSIFCVKTVNVGGAQKQREFKCYRFLWEYSKCCWMKDFPRQPLHKRVTLEIDEVVCMITQ